MLQLLATGRRFKISELAEQLETTPRCVIAYRKEINKLEFQTGCYIECKPGKEGGYYLSGYAMLPAAPLTEEEKKAFIDSLDYVLARPDFPEKDLVMKAYGKIMSNIPMPERGLDFVASVDKVKAKHNEDMRRYYQILREAIRKERRVEMTYNYLKESPKTFLADPYELVIYENEWRLLGWSHDINEPFAWKLSRITDLKITDKPFRKPANYKREQYIRNGVFIANGGMFELTLLAKGIRAKLFKEKEFGINQRCVDLPDGTTKVTLEMQDNPSTYNFLLGCGELLTVIEPREAVEKLAAMSGDIHQRYAALLEEIAEEGVPEETPTSK